jgi:hypothetical protein
LKEEGYPNRQTPYLKFMCFYCCRPPSITLFLGYAFYSQIILPFDFLNFFV